MEKLKAKIELQLSMGLIKTVLEGEKSNWLQPIVVAPKKDGSIRLCIDLRMLKKFVKRPKNPLRSPRELSEQSRPDADLSRLSMLSRAIIRSSSIRSQENSQLSTPLSAGTGTST
jgi:hypothetical protein